jgi:uncharacterized protein
MRAVDTNALVYVRRQEPPEDEVAVRLLSSLATRPQPWVLPWPCVYEFLRVVTHARIFQPATSIREALAAVELLLDSPSVVLISEGDRHAKIMADLLRRSGLNKGALCTMRT